MKKKNAGLPRTPRKIGTKKTTGKRVLRTYKQPGAVKTKHGIKPNIPETN